LKFIYWSEKYNSSTRQEAITIWAIIIFYLLNLR
jgi:hypothetical protein